MKLTSSTFENNQAIPAKYAYKTGNMSPPLKIEGVSKNVISLALIVHDPDAPMGDYTHWLFWNLPPQTTDILPGVLPAEAVQGKNDFGNNRWDGPSPPIGTHRYIFDLYALDSLVNVPPGALRKDLGASMDGHIVDKTELIGLYSA